jgi:uncharacterized protein
MPDKTPDQEPSIEEILASIRQIISDDEEAPAEPAPEPAPPPPKAAPPPKPAPPPPVTPKDDVLELTDVVRDGEYEAEPEPEPPLRRRIEIDMREVEETEHMDKEAVLTPHAASATLEGFSKLTSHMMLDREGTGHLTIEDIVKEMLRPMLREWLDENLPQLIEKLVQKELDQIARRALDE